MPPVDPRSDSVTDLDTRWTASRESDWDQLRRWFDDAEAADPVDPHLLRRTRSSAQRAVRAWAAGLDGRTPVPAEADAGSAVWRFARWPLTAAAMLVAGLITWTYVSDPGRPFSASSTPDGALVASTGEGPRPDLRDQIGWRLQIPWWEADATVISPTLFEPPTGTSLFAGSNPNRRDPVREVIDSDAWHDQLLALESIDNVLRFDDEL